MSPSHLSPVRLSEQQECAATNTSSLHGQLTHLTESSTDLPVDLSSTTRELRGLCDDLYRVLDADFPPYGAREDYNTVMEELDRRRSQAVDRALVADAREKFRDNPLQSRFELYRDGTLVGYLKYGMRAGRITFLATIGDASYREAAVEEAVEEVLIRQALLNVHRRRLALVPYCPYVQMFLAANPRFLSLIPTQ